MHNKIIYLVGLLSSASNIKGIMELVDAGRIFSLESFWYKEKFLSELKKRNTKILLDSGAFTFLRLASKKGKEASEKDKREYLDRYVQFIKENKDLFNAYVNLDVIYDPEASWKNQEYMESQGLSPMPVYHLGEDVKHFIRMLDNYEYVGVGGAVGGGYDRKGQLRCFNQLFSIMLERSPKTRIHVFGKTDWFVMTRFPWYSLDSTTWLQVAAYGSIFVPRYDFKKGEFTFEKPPVMLGVSDILKQRDCISDHVEVAFSKVEMEKLLEYLDETGFTLKQLGEDYGSRWLFNIMYYETLLKSLSKQKVSSIDHEQSFF